MANTQSLCTSFKTELLNGHHILSGATWSAAHGGVTGTAVTADTFKAALFLASATIDATTAVYSTTGEATGTYTAGGVAVTWIAPSSSPVSAATGTAFTTLAASIVYTTITLATSFDTVLIYNSTQGNKAVSVHTFTAQTITAGTLTLTMPTNNATTGLIRLA
jgi:hypothetical protein